MSKSRPMKTAEAPKALVDPLIETYPDIFSSLPPEKDQAVLLAVQRTITKIHSGPLPDPQTLAEYNAIIPHAAERIFAEFEEQGKHRRSLELLVVKGQLTQSNRGQNFAFIITVSFLIVSGSLIYLGHEWAGGSLGLASLTSLVAVFLTGKDYQKSNLKNKNPAEKLSRNN